jgi:UPF0755 protein
MDENTNKENIEIKSMPVSPKWRNRHLLIGVVVFCVGILINQMRAPDDFPKEGSVFTVAPGQSLKSVGTELESSHYIRSRFLFATFVIIFGHERSIPPGDYVFSPSTVFSLARQIAVGNHNILKIKVTIPEGDTVSEIAGILSQKIPNFDSKLFMDQAISDQGYLFPETYFFYAKTSIGDIISEMKKMFSVQTKDIFNHDAMKGRSVSDIVILASLVEREAHGDADRVLIASILTHRLERGMRLQVDASPDTYKHAGLPEAPIANPGRLALLAALNPVKTDYLFYLHDKNGTIHYAKTYTEHQANIRKYLK